ncbi:hypothetical protein UFOVP1619_10 [uncultured Caudovirales phage]|uniref:Uncharacterized protein n=1 Tax=uncultured Caudovirales phage TaxID=2100421 RepID=A0A6J5SVZ1_9CAUD|nr:hypothetical protein UFOVP1619_10 [uncultured Caudovirales phage]
MTEWKAGDRAMVEITRINGRNPMPVGYGFSIDAGSLRPLPPAMTEAEKALVEVCIAEIPEWSTGFGGTVSRIQSMYDLTQAVIAERAPPDPVEVAWHAYNKASSFMTYGPVPEWFRATLKAFDAAKGEKS